VEVNTSRNYHNINRQGQFNSLFPNKIDKFKDFMSIGSLWDKYFIKDEATYHVFHVTFMDDSMPSF
jgi:hypothetical protein